MKKFFAAFLLTFSLSYSQTCEGMFNVYDSCYDINNCDEGYSSIFSLSSSIGLSKASSEKLANVCKSSCLNKKANVKKLSKEEFLEIFCPKTAEVKKVGNPTGNNK